MKVIIWRDRIDHHSFGLGVDSEIGSPWRYCQWASLTEDGVRDLFDEESMKVLDACRPGEPPLEVVLSMRFAEEPANRGGQG